MMVGCPVANEAGEAEPTAVPVNDRFSVPVTAGKALLELATVLIFVVAAIAVPVPEALEALMVPAGVNYRS